LRNLILILILCTSSWGADDAAGISGDLAQARRWTNKQPQKPAVGGDLPKEPLAKNPIKPRLSKRVIDDVDSGTEDEDPNNDEDRKRRITVW